VERIILGQFYGFSSSKGIDCGIEPLSFFDTFNIPILEEKHTVILTKIKVQHPKA